MIRYGGISTCWLTLKNQGTGEKSNCRPIPDSRGGNIEKEKLNTGKPAPLTPRCKGSNRVDIRSGASFCQFPFFLLDCHFFDKIAIHLRHRNDGVDPSSRPIAAQGVLRSPVQRSQDLQRYIAPDSAGEKGCPDRSARTLGQWPPVRYE